MDYILIFKILLEIAAISIGVGTTLRAWIRRAIRDQIDQRIDVKTDDLRKRVGRNESRIQIHSHWIKAQQGN